MVSGPALSITTGLGGVVPGAVPDILGGWSGAKGTNAGADGWEGSEGADVDGWEGREG